METQRGQRATPRSTTRFMAAIVRPPERHRIALVNVDARSVRNRDGGLGQQRCAG